MPSTASPQRIAWIGGTVHSIIVRGEHSDGRVTVLRSSMRAPSASPVHVHRRDDEIITLLSGSAVVWHGNVRQELGPGDTAFMPKGIPHSYRITEDADVVTVCTPAGIEAFFERAGWDLARGDAPEGWQVDMEALQEAAKLTGEVVLGPPLETDDVMPEDLRTWDGG